MNIRDLIQAKEKSRKIAALTAYDASFAKLVTEAGIDVVLVGDSLGMTISGFKNTLRVTMDQMIYHTRSVRRGINQSKLDKKPLLMVDMPWGSYTCPKKALNNAIKIVRNGGDLVKIEGAESNEIKSIQLIRANSIPVCAHIGLKPQSVTMTGGFVRQGEDDQSAKMIIEQATLLDKLGVEMIVLECIPSHLAEKITQSVNATVIGIGTYSPCDGQILVIYDILGISDKQLKFSKNFLASTGTVQGAITAYVNEVKSLTFPNQKSKPLNSANSANSAKKLAN